MNLSDRNSRLLLVLTLISGVYLLTQQLYKITQNAYSVVYQKYGIGSEHILTIMMYADVLLILVLALIYSYNEANTFCKFEQETLNKYKSNADKYYQLLVQSIFIVFGLSFIIIFIASQAQTLIMLLVISSLLIFTIYVMPSLIKIFSFVFKNRFIKLHKFSIQVESLYKRNYIYKILWYWVVIFVSISLIIYVIGMDSIFDTQLEMIFSSKNKSSELNLDITYTDISPDKTPDNFVIDIVNPVKSVQMIVYSSDFNKSFIQEKNSQNGVDKYRFGKGGYTMKKRLNIADNLVLGKNQIVISFKIKDLFIKGKVNEYKVVNEVYRDDRQIIITRDQFKLKI